MEIADYARLVERRFGPVMIVTGVAAVLAALLFLARPERYVAATAVVVPTPVSSSSLLATVSQSVSDFQAAVSSTVVANEVAATTDLPPSDITGGIESTRVADSSVVEVRFEADRPAVAERVSLEVSREALVMLLSARLQPFEAQLAAAQQHYDDVQADYDAFLQRTGYVVPTQVFLQETNEMQDLRNRIGAAIAAGDTELAEELQERLDEKADRIVPDSAEFYAISNAQRVATQNLATTQASYDTAKASLDAVRQNPDDGGVLSTTAAMPVSRLQTFLEMVIPTAVIAMILAIGLVVLLEVITTRRPGRQLAVDHAEEGQPDLAGDTRARSATVGAPAATGSRRRPRMNLEGRDDRTKIPTPSSSAVERNTDAKAQREAAAKAERVAKARAQREARAKAKAELDARAKTERDARAKTERESRIGEDQRQAEALAGAPDRRTTTDADVPAEAVDPATNGPASTGTRGREEREAVDAGTTGRRQPPRKRGAPGPSVAEEVAADVAPTAAARRRRRTKPSPRDDEAAVGTGTEAPEAASEPSET